ncbi:hypothetical protein LJB62_06145 [Bacillus sp. DFI.2.34]|nr:hypothetical protein [Bacillus sp. DFI.2.34]
MTTRPFLVVILRREMLFFDDETFSRRHIDAKMLFFDDETPTRLWDAKLKLFIFYR